MNLINFRDMEIKQARFSNSVKFFEQRFLDRWNIDLYHDINAPAYFQGIYTNDDVMAINNHRGFKIIYHTGSMKSHIVNINPVNVYARVCPEVMAGRISEPTPWNEYYFNFKLRKVNFPIKDFSLFQPSQFGNKIYCYIGNEQVKYKYGYDIAEKIRLAGYEVIYGMPTIYTQGELKKVYDQCFVNLKFCNIHGYTTATEMAYMGRYTISNALGTFFKPYRDFDDIIRLIEIEKGKIGTIQQSVVGDYFDTDNEWLNESFWL